jgi:hypothetical protein
MLLTDEEGKDVSEDGIERPANENVVQNEDVVRIKQCRSGRVPTGRIKRGSTRPCV